MRVQLTILLSFLSFLMFGQAEACDTLFLKDGKKIAAVIQSETKYDYNYVLCCENCEVVRQVEKKDVFDLFLSPSRVDNISNYDTENCDIMLLHGGSKIYIQVLSETKYYYKYKNCCSQCQDIEKVKKSEVANRWFKGSTLTTLQKQKDELDRHHPISINLEIGGPLGFGGIAFEYFPFKIFGLKIGAGIPMNEGFVGNGSILFKLGKKKRFIPSIGFSNAFGIGGDSGFLTNFYSFHKPTRFGYFRISPGILIAGGDIVPALPWIGFSVGFNLFNKQQD